MKNKLKNLTQNLNFKLKRLFISALRSRRFARPEWSGILLKKNSCKCSN